MTQKAVRLTYQDTIEAQRRLKQLIKSKILTNSPLTPDEQEDFPKLLGDSFLSQGDIVNIFYNPPNSSSMISLGGAHQVCLQLEDITKTSCLIKDHTVTISDIWQLIYEALPRIFTAAIKESIHISKEVPKREETSGYTFSSDELI